MEEVDEVFHAPSENDIHIAKEHGFIMMDPFDNWMYTGNGYNTKVRAWVKPDNSGYNLRSLVCKDTPYKGAIEFKIDFGK